MIYAEDKYDSKNQVKKHQRFGIIKEAYSPTIHQYEQCPMEQNAPRWLAAPAAWIRHANSWVPTDKITMGEKRF